jgi:anionic cell wall polymer biosynthesis LytR-Cps2A-Psr (LCP) family protein
MFKAERRYQKFYLGVLTLFGAVILSLTLNACQKDSTRLESNGTPISIGETSQIIPPPSPTSQQKAASPTATPWEAQITQEGFPPPSIDPATAVPDPLDGLTLSDEVQIWVLLGSDTEPPFNGRTPAIHLLFIHPRFSKASLVSIPANLYVYIPGYTMQRISTAYAVGGIEALRQTLAYNFGITPSRFVLAHPGDFQWLVDDLDTIEVSVFYPMPQTCGGIRAGLIQMDGALALCYASFLEDMDEVDRMRRQQQLLSIIFRKFTSDGNLVKLPLLYASYQGWIETDFSLQEIMTYIPLALRLADPDRIGYFMIGSEQTTLWTIPGNSEAQVFLPNQDAVKALLQQAINDIMSPMPLTDQVQTLEAQITAAFEATINAIETLDTSQTPTLPLETQTPTWIPTFTPPSYP